MCLLLLWSLCFVVEPGTDYRIQHADLPLTLSIFEIRLVFSLPCGQILFSYLHMLLTKIL